MIRTATFVTAAAILASAAHATILGPGGSVVYPPGVPQGPSFGAPVAPPLVTPFVSSPLGNLTGSFSSTIGLSDPANPFGPGFISFYYQVTNSAASVNSIGRVANNGFAGWATDVSWMTLPGVNPFAQDRSGGLGDSIGHNFGPFLGNPPLAPGSFSVTMVVHTNAPSWTTNVTSIIDGDSAVVPSYSPAPTPGAGALLGLGLIASARRRR